MSAFWDALLIFIYYNLFWTWQQTEITKRFRVWNSAFSTAVSYLKFFSCYCLPSRWLSGTGSVPRCEGCWLFTHQYHHTLVQFDSWLTVLTCGYPLLYSHSWLSWCHLLETCSRIDWTPVLNEDLLTFKRTLWLVCWIHCHWSEKQKQSSRQWNFCLKYLCAW